MHLRQSLRTVTTSGRVLLLCVVILAQNILSRDLFSPLVVLSGISVLLITQVSFKRSYLRLVWPLLGVIMFGALGAAGHEARDILRDIAFAIVPLVLIYIGYWLAGDARMWPLILKVMVSCGTILAIFHLSAFAINPELLVADLEDVRREAGGSGALVTFALVLVLFKNRFGLVRLIPKYLPRFVTIGVLLASFVLSYSRTEIAVAIVLALSLLGTLSRLNLRFVLAVVVLVVGFLLITVSVPTNETGTLRSKLANTVAEIAVSNYRDMSDINANWRGFETYRAMQSFSTGSVVQQILGQGFGALVDLGFVMEFGKVVGVQLRYIPILHNGYAYILIKTGLLGLVCYVIFYLYVIRCAVRHSYQKNSEQEFLSRLLLGCIWSLIAVMYVVGGMAETAEPALVLLVGYLVRRLELLRVAQLMGSGNKKYLVAS